jgi:subtilisin family serine protease
VGALTTTDLARAAKSGRPHLPLRKEVMTTLDNPFRRTLLCAALALAGLALGALPARADPRSDATSSQPSQDRAYALVQLTGEPLATYVKTKPPQGKKIEFDSSTVKSYRAQLAALRNDYRAWLKANVPQAQVTGQFDISLNAVAVKLNGATLAQVSATSMVRTAQYQGLYYPLADDPDLALIHAKQAWGGGGAAGAGAGVRVAIVDTGIDITHPCFSDAGLPAQPHYGNSKLTNNKVIAARVFNNKLNQNGSDASAVQEHGSHVAGTVACNFDTPANVNGVAIPYGISGVAPAALLGNYNVFPGEIASARSEDILNALEAAYQDGFDIANMSLGGRPPNGPQKGNASPQLGNQDLLTTAVDNLDRANMVVAVAAGNEGPGHFTIGSPGTAERALSAGASTVPHFIGSPLTVGGSTYGVAAGDFKTVSADLTAVLGVVLNGAGNLSNACTAGDGKPAAGSLAGKIALISRGACTFSEKIRNSQDAGAIAAIVVNNVAGDPTAMALGGIANEPTIPAYMAALSDKTALVGDNGASATIGAAKSYFQTTNADIMAGFSSQGPTDVSFRVKPDVVAPGVNVLSSVPASACATPPCFAFLSGTSMATPHLAGSAAVVRGQHPAWSAAEVRSAVVNTADRGVLKNFQTAAPENDVNIIGSGRENLASAVAAVATLDPVSVSFGAVSSGSGQTKQIAVSVRNVSGSARTFSLGIGAQPAGVSFSLSRDTLGLAAGESAAVIVTMSASRGAPAGDQQATLDVKEGTTSVAHAVLYTFLK